MVLVGEEIGLVNQTAHPELSYTWYIDDERYKDGFETNLNLDREGFHLIRLEAEDKNCGLWSMEKPLHVRCNDEAIEIDYPDLLMQDSCYGFEISGVGSLTWQFGGQSGDAKNFELCMTGRGAHNLHLNYTQGACRKQDSLQLFVYDTEDIGSRDYVHKIMEFDGEKLLQENVHISQTAFDEYLIAGINTESQIENDLNYPFSINVRRNFIRKWNTRFDQIQEWELYEQDSLRQELVDSLYISPILEIRDVYRDKDGFTYVFSNQGQVLAYVKAGFYVMKLDILGNIVWNKFIYARTDQEYLLNRENVQIKEVGGELIIYYGEFFLKMNKAGEVLESRSLVRGPTTLFPSGTTDHIYRDANEEVIFQFSRDEEHFAEEPDSLGFFGIDDIRQLLITVYTHDLDLVAERVLVDDYFSSIGSLAVKSVKGGAVLYFRSSDVKEGSVTSGTFRHYFIKLNNQGEVVWKRAYENLDSEGNNRQRSSTYLDILANGDIVSVGPILDGNLTSYLRLDEAGNLLEHRHYLNTPPFEPLIRTIDQNQASKIGTRAEDGYMFLANKGRFFHEALILQHIPLDAKYDSCAYTDTMRMQEISFELKDYASEGFMQEIPIVLEVEDAPVSVKRKNYSSMSICGSSQDVEDYSLTVLDSICVNNEWQLNMEVCRQKSTTSESISMLVFYSSPFNNKATLFQQSQITFEAGDSCIAFQTSLPSGEKHLLLNAKADYRRPYTRGASFFDGAEKLEHDYENNYVRLFGCEGGVSVNASSSSKSILHLFPNPTTDQLNIEVGDVGMQQISVYNLLGQKVLRLDKIELKQLQIQTSNWEVGSYIIQVQLTDGRYLTGRFVKG